MGLALAGIGALLALVQIGASPGGAIIGLAINGFILYALWTTASAFHR
jgi:hypothetical protein